MRHYYIRVRWLWVRIPNIQPGVLRLLFKRPPKVLASTYSLVTLHEIRVLYQRVRSPSSSNIILPCSDAALTCISRGKTRSTSRHNNSESTTRPVERARGEQDITGSDALRQYSVCQTLEIIPVFRPNGYLFTFLTRTTGICRRWMLQFDLETVTIPRACISWNSCVLHHSITRVCNMAEYEKTIRFAGIDLEIPAITAKSKKRLEKLRERRNWRRPLGRRKKRLKRLLLRRRANRP